MVHPGQRAPPPREDIGRSRPADVFTLPPLTLVGLTITDVEDLDWASCQSVGKAAWFLGQANTVPCLRHRAITERRHKASNSTAVFVLYSVLVREIDRFHYALVAGTLAFLILAVALVALGASLGVALLAVAAAPFVVVIGYETLGHQHEASALERLAITTGTPAT